MMLTPKLDTKKTLLAIFILALAIRLFFGIHGFLKNGTSHYTDDWLYIHYAKNIISQGIAVPDIESLDSGIAEPDGKKFKGASVIGPGYPLMVASLFILFGDSVLSLVFFNAIIGALLCVLIFFLGKEIAGKRAGLLASGWSIFYFISIANTSRVQKETFLSFLLLLLVLVFIKALRERKIIIPVLVCSLVFSFLIHTDERYFAYFPLFFLFFVFMDKERLVNGLKKGLLFSFAVIMLMMPWLLRNYHIYGKVVLLTTRTSHITDKVFGYPEGNYPVAGHGMEDVLKPGYISRTQVDSALTGLRATDNAGNTLGKARIADMKNGRLPHSFSLGESYWSVFVQLWQPARFNSEYLAGGFRYVQALPLQYNLAVLLTYGLLLPFMLIGLVALFRDRRRYAVLLLSMLSLHTLIHVFFIPFTRARYRFPIDAIVIILGIYGLLCCYDFLKKKYVSRSDTGAIEEGSE